MKKSKEEQLKIKQEEVKLWKNIKYDENIVNLNYMDRGTTVYYPDAMKWDNVICPHANKDEKTCSLASEIANQKISIEPSTCMHCSMKSSFVNIQNTSDNSDGVQWVINDYLTKTNKNAAYTAFRNILGPGPGTELHKIIPKFLESESCSCRDMAKKMNIWGPDKCELHREYLVDYLVTKGKDVKLFGWVPQKMMREVANRMLTMAINRAKNNETEDWFVAVTTAPRKDATVNMCLESLSLAGFRPYIFSEPGDTGIDLDTYGDKLITHKERQGVWRNWIYSAKYAIENSSSEIIMTVQDDALFHPDSKTFAESILWPSSDVGFVSLYTPKHYSFKHDDKAELKPPGVNKIITRSLWGSLALIWPRDVLQEVLCDPMINQWLGVPSRKKSLWNEKKETRKKNPSQIQNSDTAIGKIMNKMKRSMYFVDPSAVTHIAENSAIGHGDNKGRRNCIRCAKFSQPLHTQVPLMNNEQELIKVDYKNIQI
jgi:hypothetical protein